jgi:hypothetical protein
MVTLAFKSRVAVVALCSLIVCAATVPAFALQTPSPASSRIPHRKPPTAERPEAHEPETAPEKKTAEKPDDTKPITFPEHATQITLWSLFVGLALGLVLYRVVRFAAERFPKDRFRVEWVWIVISVGGALGHALFVGTKVGEHWEPLFDTTTLLWIGVAGIGLLYPRLSEVTLGTFGFKVEEAVKDVSDVVDKALGLTDKWAYRLNRALAELPPLDADTVELRVAMFLREAAIDAITWMGEDGESRRLAYWVYDSGVDRLGLFLSPDITAQSDPAIVNHLFGPGEGLLRKVLAWPPPAPGVPGPTSLNLANAKKENGYQAIPGDHSRYKGLLIVPIRTGDTMLGVISVDRSLQEKFPSPSVKLVESLASMTGILIGEPTIRQKLGIL